MIINWVDIAIIALLARGIFLLKKVDFITEVFKFLGVYIATIIALHYYVVFGEVVAKYLLVPPIIKEVFAYCFLALFIILLFYFVREGWQHILKVQSHPAIDKWFGGILKLVRFYLIAGMLVLALVISGNRMLMSGAKRSLSANIVKSAPLAVYETFYQGFLVKFFAKEKINDKIWRLFPQQ